ncbi:hypothetical protein AB205_0191570, partial [Aquarana catesbeiana]
MMIMYLICHLLLIFLPVSPQSIVISLKIDCLKKRKGNSDAASTESLKHQLGTSLPCRSQPSHLKQAPSRPSAMFHPSSHISRGPQLMAIHTIVSTAPSTSVIVSPLQLNTTTKSSVPPSLNMNKQTICAKHLKGLTGIRWKNFKLALCSTKPPGKAEGIKMRNLNDKSVEYIVDSIFRCFTKRRGPGIIMGILRDLNENEIRCSIQRDISKGG